MLTDMRAWLPGLYGGARLAQAVMRGSREHVVQPYAHAHRVKRLQRILRENNQPLPVCLPMRMPTPSSIVHLAISPGGKPLTSEPGKSTTGLPSCGEGLMLQLTRNDGHRMTDKSAINVNSPLPGFVQQRLANGLTISTCLLCMKSIASPTPASLRIAEENHPCAARSRKSS